MARGNWPHRRRTSRWRRYDSRNGARFIYEYDLNIPWRHEVRIEDRLEPETRKFYPVCAAGDGACPPEDCGGPESFMDHRDDWYSFDALSLVNRLRCSTPGRDSPPARVAIANRLHPRLQPRRTRARFTITPRAQALAGYGSRKPSESAPVALASSLARAVDSGITIHLRVEGAQIPIHRGHLLRLIAARLPI